MSLYLCVFDRENELGAVEVGSYDDFGAFRNAIASQAEGGTWGSRFPTLMNHPDADGEWARSALPALRRELEVLAEVPALAHYTDIDGVPLAHALLALCDTAIASRRPILFQ